MEMTLDEMGLDLNCNLDTAVDNLFGAGLLDRYEPNGPDWYIIRERDGEFVMGEKKFPAAVHGECGRALEYIRSMDPSDEDGKMAVADGGDPYVTNEDSETLREELARKLGFEPGELENYLRVGTPQNRREKLERLVKVIRDSETFEMPDSFDEIRLIPKGYRYHRAESVLSTA
ncbi:hypothetical protein HAPAU_41880 [Halalkalicoccus paucihalophilus]|uniref:Uncharacterized protein n=1 Tax=Halalkalicoccus paucihalophilus TaxID=1008153 RepID=A0A151A7M9_9EURY|nr:hypothetical protein [Halalkalicoccus paucihalophilus]KYH23708.1 hypothetical protein HAPAU_41880 [Halalkalicoccus paucihalophilus]